MYFGAQADLHSISRTVRGEQWRGLSALHPSKCLMNHLSLPPSRDRLSLALSPPSHPVIYFFSLHPCLSVSLLLRAHGRHILVQDEVWMLTRRKKKEKRRNLNPISPHSSTSLWPESRVAKYIICLSLNFSLDVWNFAICGAPAALSVWWGSLGLTVRCILSGC